MADESNYKREEDRLWRARTEERIVGLTSSEAVQNDRLDDLDGDVHTIREILEGRANDKDDNGMKGDLHDMAVGLNELRRLMAPDHLGQGGVIARLHTLEDLAGIRIKRTEYRWKFWIAFLGFLSAVAVAVITNLDRLEPSVKRFLGAPAAEISPASRKAGAKTNRKRRRRPAAMEAPTEATDGAPQDDVPDGRGGNDSDAQ